MPISSKCSVLALLLASFGLGADTDSANSLITKPLNISAALDFGQMVNGSSIDPPADFKGQFLQRTGVWLTQEAAVNRRLEMTISVGGMFFYTLPEASGTPKSLITKFGPSISRAYALYKFGEDTENPPATLELGYFPYRYNPDAKNLGEYLLRSGTYPGILNTGGWNIISSQDNPMYMTQGLKLTLGSAGGRFRSDFLLPMERDLPPMYSLSPSYVATLNAIPGLELGAGLTWNHGISVKPSKEHPHVPGNQVITGRSINPDTNAVLGGDPYYLYKQDSTQFYTFQGFKTMARFALDPQAWFPNEILGPADLRLYGEVALLGIKNYPFLYEKPSERMPMMVGFNLPAFRFLDVLGVEVEQYKSPFENSIYEPYQNQTPIWRRPEDPRDLIKGTPANYGQVVAAANAQTARTTEDDFKWTVYAKKEVYKGLRLYAQVANDHMRPTDINVQLFYTPVTNRSGKDWYYLVRLEFGI